MPDDLKTPEPQTRRFPMSKPEGHKPAVQRYSAEFPPDVRTVRSLYLGIQRKDALGASLQTFLAETNALFALSNGPDHVDMARLTDPEGYDTAFCVAYWTDEAAHGLWANSAQVSDWWSDPDKLSGDTGYFWESLSTTLGNAETIAFKEYIRGLSACPHAQIAAMDESGYWGGARDRIPNSGHDAFEPTRAAIRYTPHDASLGQRVFVGAPANLCLIRSGVSWEACGEEQLTSYRTNIEPKLDTGMEFLRQNPEETGCLSLRQVRVITAKGDDAPEAYSAGYFLSLGHLERWSKSHPTHLAIYSRAQMERKKYGEKLELRTYHEVYVQNLDARFEYLNCHGRTGLLPIQFLDG